MNISEYQEASKAFAIFAPDQADNYLSLGLISETGELAGKLKKIIRDNDGHVTPELTDELIFELGDVLWYVTQLATRDGVELIAFTQVEVDKEQLIEALFDLHETGALYYLGTIEIGEVLESVEMVAAALGTNLQDVARLNIHKLTQRQGAGTLGGSGDHR